VIPAYWPVGVDARLAAALLTDTVKGCLEWLDSPNRLCLAADGAGAASDYCAQLAAQCGLGLRASPRNRGKLSAVLNGMQLLLESPEIRYLAVLDQDGDHFPNELINLVRAARHAEAAGEGSGVMVLGRRTSRHRPLGYLRGELEELADRVLFDALVYRAAVSGCPLPLQFATVLEEVPDAHSGFKLFSRSVAERVFAGEFWSEGLSEDCTYRHAVEAVMTVEALLSGAILVLVTRSAANEQPISTFGLLDRARLVADKIIWPCKRLGAPPPFVAQWLDNHLPRLQLGTLAPEGKRELLEIRRLVRVAFGLPDDSRREIVGPLFV
jgi:hypothetical protein